MNFDNAYPMSHKKKKKVLILGVTGNYGSGKTTVARMFHNLGAACIDADKIYHQLIKRGTALYRNLVADFGKGILGKYKQINRKKLSKLAFGSTLNLKKLAQITHPGIIAKIKSELARLKKMNTTKVIVIDAPLLIEAGLTNLVNKIIVVMIKPEKQVMRCIRLKNISRREARQRIKNQMPLAKKVKLADFVIDNNGTLKKTKKQVQGFWQKIK